MKKFNILFLKEEQLSDIIASYLSTSLTTIIRILNLFIYFSSILELAENTLICTIPVLYLVQSIPQEKKIIKWVSEIILQVDRKFCWQLRKKNHDLSCPLNNTYLFSSKTVLV